MMVVDERARQDLYEELNGVLGAQATGTLMALLPSTSWPEVATRTDVTATRNELRSEVGVVRGEVAELRTDIGVLRGEVAEVRSEVGVLRGEVAEVRTDVDGLRVQVRDLASGLDATKADLVTTRTGLQVQITALQGEMLHRFAVMETTILAVKNELLASFRGEMVAAVSAQTRTIVFAMVASLVGMGGMALSLARFG